MILMFACTFPSLVSDEWIKIAWTIQTQYFPLSNLSSSSWLYYTSWALNWHILAGSWFIFSCALLYPLSTLHFIVWPWRYFQHRGTKGKQSIPKQDSNGHGLICPKSLWIFPHWLLFLEHFTDTVTILSELSQTPFTVILTHGAPSTGESTCSQVPLDSVLASKLFQIWDAF